MGGQSFSHPCRGRFYCTLRPGNRAEHDYAGRPDPSQSTGGGFAVCRYIDLYLELAAFQPEEGFNSFPAPPGYGFYTSTLLPKPAIASRHSVELILVGVASGIVYSVLYDGSIITGDDRHVEREDVVFSGIIGINYHYYDFFSIRLAFNLETDIINEDALPQALPGKVKTGADNSYGSLMIDFHF